jgi:hypothetical protein
MYSHFVCPPGCKAGVFPLFTAEGLIIYILSKNVAFFHIPLTAQIPKIGQFPLKPAGFPELGRLGSSVPSRLTLLL